MIKPDHDNNWLHIEWNGYLTDSAVKEGVLAISETLLKPGLSCLLNDMLQVLGPIRSSDWAVNEWAPKVSRLGLKHMSMVTLQEAMAVPNVSNFHSRQTNFQTDVFHNLHKASNIARILQNSSSWLHNTGNIVHLPLFIPSPLTLHRNEDLQRVN